METPKNETPSPTSHDHPTLLGMLVLLVLAALCGHLRGIHCARYAASPAVHGRR